MKAVLKMARPSSSPPSSGVMASRMETAPRRPTQEMKAVSWRWKAEGDEAEPDGDRTRDEDEEKAERDRDGQDGR